MWLECGSIKSLHIQTNKQWNPGVGGAAGNGGGVLGAPVPSLVRHHHLLLRLVLSRLVFLNLGYSFRLLPRASLCLNLCLHPLDSPGRALRSRKLSNVPGGNRVAGGVGGGAQAGGADSKPGLAPTLDKAVGRVLAADTVGVTAPPHIMRAPVARGAAAGAVGCPRPRGAFGLWDFLPPVAVAVLAREQAAVRRPPAASAASAAAVSPLPGAGAEAVFLAACAVGAVDDVALADAFVARAGSAVEERVAAGPGRRVAALSFVGAYAGGVVVGGAAFSVQGSERLDDFDRVSFSLSLFSFGMEEDLQP